MKSKRTFQPESFPEPKQPDAFGGREAEGEAATASGSAGSAAAEPGQPPSMAESVTRHAQNPPVGNFQFLLCGIDTLDLGLFVSWDARWSETKEYLSAKKEAAQGTTGLLDKTDISREFLHQPSGKAPNYRYQLQFPEYRLYIAISDKVGKSPNVYATITAEALWHVGISTLLELLAFDLESLSGTIERIQPSRCDLCADFRIVPSPTLPFIQDHRVSRCHVNRSHMDGDTLETFYCGSPKSPVQIRMYDKGKEIGKSDKKWFLNLWGLDSPDNVWRVEFQLRRAFLHQYRINSLSDLWDRIGAIWEYLTGEWFSLRIPDNDKAERRTLHPWWLTVQECRHRLGHLTDAKRTFTSDTVEPIQRTLSHIVGRMVSIAAQSGIKDRKEAILYLGSLLDKRTNDEKFAEEYHKRLIKLGFRGTLGGSDDEES